MQKFIERLKDKPEHHRRRFAFAVSASFTAFIFIVWASVIFPSGVRSTIAQTEEVKPKGDTPLSTLRTGVAQVYEAVQGIMDDPQLSPRSLNLEAEYERMKSQVENGEIQFVPGSTNN